MKCAGNPTRKNSSRRERVRNTASIVCQAGLPVILFALFLEAAAAAPVASHLRLVDRLDRPEDGYCIDILGTGDYLRLDLPLFAHNCKRGLTTDSAVVFEADGSIRFPAVDRCITVAGVNSLALPGASVLLRGCGEASAFFETAELQRFELHADGRLTLKSTGLCLAVGAESAVTYSSFDRWRALFVENCERVPAARSRWEFVVPAPPG